MVQIFKFLLKSTKGPPRAHFRPSFLDTLRLTVRGGHGGNGLPKYGGVGGQGGCVYFVAKEGVTLRKLAQSVKDKRVVASGGEDSSKVCIFGRRGVDQRLEVPIGVQVYDEQHKLLGDLNEPDATCIAAGGGVGGCVGNNFIGRPGDSRTVNLDLKLIADVGLVGFPNAGKSTLLKAISNAKPKIAAYPFTTIRPQIGTIEYSDLRCISVADLPGLIEGAHANFGMGHKFLKHIERTRLLLFMVDIFGFQLSQQHPHRDCLTNIYALNKELELYDASLLEKPCVLLVNKMDQEGAQDIWTNLKPCLNHLESQLAQCPEELRPTQVIKFERILPISAKNLGRVAKVKSQLRETLDKLAEQHFVADGEHLREELQQRVGVRGPKIT
ncbi:GTP-binding protein 10 homolog [Scaptodrosophila lebanonensis]|uniref:GTP-binding protein 10 homolog n=1 Tax=Drosophila lebanonensis TaxID=7225 RepID=A0A6J2U201_DROLE|nr:GTP-binding protein 10 homolog [Scaptodrosophila lebanonensis]